MARAAIFGCAGLELSSWERSFFRESDPWGFIVFARNIETPDQLRALTAALRETVGREAPILVDQEGGRVQRLSPPHWRAAPPQRCFGELAERDLHAGLRAAWLNSRLLAAELHDVGLDVDCLPLLDQLRAETHDVIGDRAFGGDLDLIAELGETVTRGLLAGGVLPVMKHIPGHGRGNLDSHKELPRVEASYSDLLDNDFKPFKTLNYICMAMTAHVVFEAIDPAAPATTSAKVLKEIRETIGFDGLLMSDDLGMEALSGSFAERTAASLEAGCDVVLHCSGKAEEMQEVASELPELSGASAARAEAALAQRETPKACDREAALAELEALLGSG